jgi:hypothetical protein
MSLISARNEKEWQSITRVLAEQGGGDFYYHPRWARLHERDGSAGAFHFQRGEDHFFVPLILESIPETDWRDGHSPYGYTGPLATTEDPGFLRAAWEAMAEELAEKRVIAVFIRFHPLLENHRFASGIPNLDVDALRPTVYRTLGDTEESLLASYKGNVRNKIRKAQKKGAEIFEASGKEGLLRFARIYQGFMRNIDANDMYRFDRDYFLELSRAFPEAVRIFLATLQAEDVGGILTLQGPRFAHVHLSAVTREARRMGVSNLLRHTAIAAYLGKKKAMHFGGGTSNDEKDPLLRFKMGFSRSTLTFRIGKFLVKAAAYASLVRDWEARNPERAPELESIFLRYRF